jgi:hypothetical protein
MVRIFIICPTLAAAYRGGMTSAAAPTGRSQPNILVIMTDGHNAGVMGRFMPTQELQVAKDGPDEAPPLERGLGLLPATSLNVANMVGIGPFITIPLFVATMQGPHAMIGRLIAAVSVLCDGLVWSELGAA